MTDPYPLLYRTGSSESDQPPPSRKTHTTTSLDDTIEHCIGNIGWAQIFQATLVSLAWFFDAQQTFISVFTDADPKWTCNSTSTSTCTTTTDLCHLPADAWSWASPPNTSIISDWSLQCSGSLITGLPASAFLFGCLIGGFALATLADSSMGRKNLLVFSSLVMSITGILTAFSSNFWIYSGLRFLSGFGRATIGTCALVLSTELVGRKYRESVGILGFICFTLGFLSLPAIAFSLKSSSWRLMYLWTCLPSLFYSVSVFYLVRESPRWLYIKGRKEEFAETLRSMAGPTNRAGLTQSFFGRCTDRYEEKPESSSTDNIFSAVRMLAESGWGIKRLAAVMVVGFGIGMIYYGMPLGLGSLSVDLYVSVTLNALSEFPASLVTFLLIGKLGRKGFVVGLVLLSGICSVGCVLVRWKVTGIGLELVSFFSACTAFDVVLIYTLELFPTCVRNSAVSMVRQALVLGGAISPVLVAAGRKNGLLSYGVFGVTIAVCGMFVVFLPETRGKVMCDTMEEEEIKIRNACNDGVFCV